MHLIVSGRVQGVFYRKSAQEEASRLNLRGFVRNLENGDVEVVAEGERSQLEAMAAWCQKGPQGAFVSGVDIKWEKPEGDFAGFKISYS